MASYLETEVEGMGFKINSDWLTGVETSGTMNDCIKLNLNIRTGNQVLYLLEEFKAADATELYNHLVNMPWEEWINENGYICITSNVTNPTIDNELFANVKCKDAIVDRISSKKMVRPDSGPERNCTVVHLHWKEDEVSIYMDSSGETLAKHGYRKIPGLAPMQENLAAAVIMATGWKADSHFVNPMCGSGTLAIEAAMMGLNRFPGLLRTNYGFMHVKGYDDSVYLAERNLLHEKSKKTLDFKIIASDISETAIEAARKNAEVAGVAHLINFDICDFSETNIPEGKGIVVFNPEYGERLGEFDHLEIVYKGMGDFMKQRCKGYYGYILTASPNLAKKVGLAAKRKIPFYNSVLDCRLLEYELYDGTRRKVVGEELSPES